MSEEERIEMCTDCYLTPEGAYFSVDTTKRKITSTCSSCKKLKVCMVVSKLNKPRENWLSGRTAGIVQQLGLIDMLFGRPDRSPILIEDDPEKVLGLLADLNEFIFIKLLSGNVEMSPQLIKRYTFNGKLKEHIMRSLDNAYDVALEQCHKREEL